MDKLFLLPHNCVSALTMYDKDNTQMCIGAIVPEKSRTITLQHKETEKVKIKTPPMLWVQTITRGNYDLREYSVYCLKTTKKHIKMATFDMANQAEDGGICWGHLNDDQDEEDLVPLNLREAEETFFSTPFTDDMSNPNGSDNFDFKKHVSKFKPKYNTKLNDRYSNIVSYKKHADAIFYTESPGKLKQYKKYVKNMNSEYDDTLEKYLVGFAHKNTDTNVWTVDLKGETFELKEEEKTKAMKAALAL